MYINFLAPHIKILSEWIKECNSGINIRLFMHLIVCYFIRSIACGVTELGKSSVLLECVLQLLSVRTDRCVVLKVTLCLYYTPLLQYSVAHKYQSQERLDLECPERVNYFYTAVHINCDIHMPQRVIKRFSRK